MTSTPETVVQVQLDAYNARDLEAFLACFSDDVAVYDWPHTPRYQGRDALRVFYTHRFADNPELHCKLVNRITIGNHVVDREQVFGAGGVRLFDVAAIYEVIDGLITTMTFIPE